jgi:hypothetical protein
MIKQLFAVSIAAAFGLATLSIEAKGFGSHASHTVGLKSFTGSPVRHYHRAFRYSPYGGLVAADYANGIDPVVDVSTTQSLGPLIPASFASSCHHSVEIKTVPSEEGGTREITIRRC